MEFYIDEYIDKIINSNDFKRLKELKLIIDEKYNNEILNFKTMESKYLDAKRYNDRDLIKKTRIDFMNAKSKLYEIDIVKEYLSLERKIGNMINQDFDKLKKSISNNIGDKNGIKC